MALSSGTRLGSYEIGAQLGAGGMGEVYQATDSRLKRQVAIKVLPASLAADPDRLSRFQREAETLASVNHPNIAAIYGLEDALNVKGLVMELVEGPTLADRLARGPIPIDEALPIARQIAEALEAAHAQGIIHRDLKPANIKVRDDGAVKVLDFGLAKLADAAAAGRRNVDSASAATASPAALPTLTNPAMVTGVGTVLGTAAYMSPEQARGRAVDKRTDIWAFGAVLYEMLTGARAFVGDDVTDVIAEVVKSTPNWSALPADTPSAVVTLIQRCLEKDRQARIGDIAVARFLLTEAWTPTPTAAANPGRSRLGVAVAIGAAAVLGFAVGWVMRQPAAVEQTPTHLTMSVSPAEQLPGSIAAVRPARTAMTLSPDGQRVVFSGTRGVTTQLYLRALDWAEATPIPGTEGGMWPFMSPDGAWIGFWADNKIKKMPIGGGAVATVCEVPTGGGYGVGWGDGDTIFFANRFGVFQVAAGGGTPATVVAPDATKSERLLLPKPLPGRTHVLFTAMNATDWNSANVVMHALDTGERTVLIEGGADARYVSTGHLVYMKAATLMAVPFDLGTRRLTGSPVALIENVMQAMNAANGGDETGAGQFAVSASGTLLYVVGGLVPPLNQALEWIDRNGVAEPVAGTSAAPFVGLRLSPDGQRLAVAMRGDQTRSTDVWVHDLQRGVPTRFTFGTYAAWPIWSPDGKRLAYDAGGLYLRNADLSDQPARLAPSQYPQIPSSWSTGNVLAFVQRTDKGPNAIWVLPMEGDQQPRIFAESSFSLNHPEFSPDGRWIAYTSNETGNPAVYVQPYPGPGEKIRLSTATGTEPIWSKAGRELLYRTVVGDKQVVMSVAVSSSSPFRAEQARPVFTAANLYSSTAPVRGWDVSADGKRFLMAKVMPSSDKPVTTMHVVLNWTQELKRRVPVN
jgi:eukaryotic-like serine/threonine-protein kinase